MNDVENRYANVKVTLHAIDGHAGHHELRAGSRRSIRLVFTSSYAAEAWFAAFLSTHGRSTRISPADGTPKEFKVAGRLVDLSLDVLGTADAAPGTGRMGARTNPAWVPSQVGPGILENVATGRTMAFERIDLRGDGRDRGWVRAPRGIVVHAVSGPRWPIELLAPPALTAPDGDDRSSTGSGLQFVTAAGVLRCRDARPSDQALLSRLSRHSRDLEPPALTQDEVRELLDLAAGASARARRPSGAIDLDAYATEFRQIERYEVLLSEDRTRTVGLRHRIVRSRGGSSVRVRAAGTRPGWVDPSESLVLAATQGWTRRRVVEVRPNLAHHFATGEDISAAFVELCRAGVSEWTEIDDKHRETIIEWAYNYTEWELDGTLGELLEEEAIAAEIAALDTGECDLSLSGPEQTQTATVGPEQQPPAASADPRKEAEWSDRWDYDMQQREIWDMIEAKEWRTWTEWLDACEDDPRTECPIGLDELAWRTRWFASVDEHPSQ